MSGKRARAERKDGQEDVVWGARVAIATANRLLTLDLSDIDSDRTRQFIVGWLRHVFEQSRVIATLTLADLAHAAGPNRRSLAETVVRLQWLKAMAQKDRAGVLDRMIDLDREHIRKAFNHLSDMGLDIEADLSEMDAMILEATASGTLRNQSKVFVDAAKATLGQSAGLYYMWREETQYTHATGVLAVAYAPNDRQEKIGKGRPPVADGNLQTLWMATAVAIALAEELLVDEGISTERTKTLIHAFFDVP